MSKRYRISCPGCGKIFEGARKRNEVKKSFECDKCTMRFSVTFEYPTIQELERKFLEED